MLIADLRLYLVEVYDTNELILLILVGSEFLQSVYILFDHCFEGDGEDIVEVITGLLRVEVLRIISKTFM